MWTIAKTFSFEAGHRLAHLDPSHKCYRRHGHSYETTLVFQSLEIDEEKAWVFDYGDLDPIKEWINNTLDHHDLNEVMQTDRATAERLAWYIWNKWNRAYPSLVAVEVKETRNTYAIYQGRDATG